MLRLDRIAVADPRPGAGWTPYPDIRTAVRSIEEGGTEREAWEAYVAARSANEATTALSLARSIHGRRLGQKR